MTEDQTRWPDQDLVDRANLKIQQVYPALITEMDRIAREDEDVPPLGEICDLAKTLLRPGDEIVVEHQTFDVETQELSEPQVVAAGVIGYIVLAQRFAGHVMAEHPDYGKMLDDALETPEIDRLIKETATLKSEIDKLRPRGVG